MFYVYKLLDKFGRTVYVGKTKELSGSAVYQYLKEHRKLNLKSFYSVTDIIYAEMKSETDAKIYTSYYINLDKPIFNKGWVRGTAYGAYLPEPVWERIKVGRKQSTQYLSDKELESVSVDTWEYDWDGCRVLRMEGVPVHTIDLLRDSVMGINIPKYRYCRFILVNGKRYYHIQDIEGVIAITPDGRRCSEIQARSGEVDTDEFLILYDSTLKERGHHVYKIPIRFGSEKWLTQRIIKQLICNKNHKTDKYTKTGWTRELHYLAENVIKNKEYIKEKPRRKLEYLGSRDKRMAQLESMIHKRASVAEIGVLVSVMKRGDLVRLETTKGIVEGMFKRRTPKTVHILDNNGVIVGVRTPNIRVVERLKREELGNWGDLKGLFLYEVLLAELVEKFQIEGLQNSICVESDEFGIRVKSHKHEMRIKNGCYRGEDGFVAVDYAENDKIALDRTTGIRTVYKGELMSYGKVCELLSVIYLES